VTWKGKVRKKGRGEEDRWKRTLPAVEEVAELIADYRSQVLIDQTIKDTGGKDPGRVELWGKRCVEEERVFLKSEWQRGVSPMGRHREIHGGEVRVDAM
jgi:biotin synthase-related radical SAM superfamily protein